MKTVVTVLVLCSALTVFANDRILTYVGFDHVLDYSPSTGNLRAFDFRRHLPSNDTCDFFVFPPLIESAKFIDVVTSAMPTANVEISYLGGEMFLVQDSASGSYTIRRCSGFMPQQTKIPCEVWSVGHDPSFLAPNRFFYAGDQRVIRYNSKSRAFDLLWFDQDIHGGGFPFGEKISGQFSAFEDASVTFSVVKLPEFHLLVAQDRSHGEFKVWKYNVSATRVDDMVGQMVLSGTLLPTFQITTLGENHVIAYDVSTGDFEIWAFGVTNGRVAIDVIKRDTLIRGHSCLYDNRFQCVASPGCGWCEDSITCHQIDQSRNPCDKSQCLSIVDASSPDSKKYQKFEMPLPQSMRRFGDRAAVDPVSPLRDLSNNTAAPILRTGDLEDEKILDGVRTNPSEGIVFVPPRPTAMPCMDNEYQDPRTIAPPDLKAAADRMNLAEGVAVPYGRVSPDGDASSQFVRPTDCTDTPINITRNVTRMSSLPANLTALPPKPSRTLVVPDLPGEQVLPADRFAPNNDGTAKEEDLMNGVRSIYSSLMPKGSDIKAERNEENDPPAPLTKDALRELEFKPREPRLSQVYTSAPSTIADMPPRELYSARQMENGPALSHRPIPSVQTSRSQQNAMENSQYQSIRMDTPPQMSAAQVTQENIHDFNGWPETKENQIKSRPDEPIVEGWQTKSVKSEVAQLVPTDELNIVAPPPKVSTVVLNAIADRDQQARVSAAGPV